MGARRGGETDQQNLIMHKAYWPNMSLTKNRLKIYYNKCTIPGGEGTPIYWLYGFMYRWKGYGFRAI